MPSDVGLSSSCQGADAGSNEVEPRSRPKEQADEMALEDGMAGWVAPSDWTPLPADPNFHHPDMRLYRRADYVELSFNLAAGCVEHRARFQARASDVVVASFPKSGTTWLEEIVWRVVHGKTSASGDDDTPLEYRVPLIDLPSTSGMRFRSVHEMESPRLLKTHLPYSVLPGGLPSSGAKLLYVSRDSRDVCVSYYHMCRVLNLFSYRGTFRQFMQSFMRDQVMYGPYREHVRGYLAHSDTVLCVTYEQMHSDRPAVVKKVAAFLGKTLTEADVEAIVRYTSFSVMRDNPSTNFRHWEDSGMVTKGKEGTFMRKGVVGDWKNYFTEEESEAFMKWLNEVV